MNLLENLQWPAMATTVLATYWVASHSERKRNLSFWLYCLSNVLWIAWGIHDHAIALIVLQVILAGLNIRGLCKTDDK